MKNKEMYRLTRELRDNMRKAERLSVSAVREILSGDVFPTGTLFMVLPDRTVQIVGDVRTVNAVMDLDADHFLVRNSLQITVDVRGPYEHPRLW